MSPRSLVATLALVAALGASAQAELRVGVPPVIPSDGHAIISASVTEAEGSLAVYFRRQGHGDFYFVPMSMKDGSGSALLPRPSDQTEAVELFVGLRDDSGQILGRSATVIVPVGASAAAKSESGGSFVVGNTVNSQDGHDVAWFEAEGISSHLSSGGRSSMGGGGSSNSSLVNVIIVGGDDNKEVTLPRP